jgi:hypothetical protein
MGEESTFNSNIWVSRWVGGKWGVVGGWVGKVSKAKKEEMKPGAGRGGEKIELQK